MNPTTIIDAVNAYSYFVGVLFILTGFIAIYEVCEDKHHNIKIKLCPFLLILCLPVELVLFCYFVGTEYFLDMVFGSLPTNMVFVREMITAGTLSSGAILCVLHSLHKLHIDYGRYIIGLALMIAGLFNLEFHTGYNGFNTVTGFNKTIVYIFSSSLVVVGLLQWAEVYFKQKHPYQFIWAIILISHGLLNLISHPHHFHRFTFNQNLETLSSGEILLETIAIFLVALLFVYLFMLLYKKINHLSWVAFIRNKLQQKEGLKD